jgi:hypothetical protein
MNDNSGIAIYAREDGRRGLKALKNFKKGQTLFIEKPFLWIGLAEDKYNEGLAWALTRNIATKFPDKVVQMEEGYKLQETFRPNLDQSDEMSLADIAKVSKYPMKWVNKVYNLVCTYNTKTELVLVAGSDAHIAERMTISTVLIYANHSCIPNSKRLPVTTIAEYQRNEDSLIALENITKGQEITWNYLADGLANDLKHRQKQLKESFGFDCTCNKCLLEMSVT